MNTNWSKILLFSLISFALGWLVCHFACSGCDDRGRCHEAGMCCMASCEGGHGHEGASCEGHGESNADRCKKGHGHHHKGHHHDADSNTVTAEADTVAH